MQLSRTEKVFVAVAGAWLVGWYGEMASVSRLLAASRHVDVVHPLFPGPLSATETAHVAYFAPALLGLGFWGFDSSRAKVIGVGFLLCALALCFHVDFFTEARFTVFVWVGVWLTWLAFQLDDADGRTESEIAWTVKSTLAMAFFCAGLVKWTEAFWSGDILFDLYYADSDVFLYPWLRKSLTAETYRAVATRHAQLVVVGESAMLLALFVPYNLFAAVALGVAGGTVLSAGYVKGVGALMLPMATMVVAAGWLRQTTESTGREEFELGGVFAMPDLREWSPSGLTVIALHGLCVVATIAMSSSTRLQHEWMKVHHATQRNGAIWALAHPIPKMYGFEHRTPVVRWKSSPPEQVEASDGEFFTDERPSWFQHYPIRHLTWSEMQVTLVELEADFEAVLFSRYRATCLLSFVEVEPRSRPNRRDELKFTTTRQVASCRGEAYESLPWGAESEARRPSSQR